MHSIEFSSSVLGGSLLGGGTDGGSSLDTVGVGFGAKVVDGLGGAGTDVEEEPEGRSPEEVLGGRAHSGCKIHIDQFK